MNTQSGKRRALRLVALAAAVAVAAMLGGTTVASAQPGPERGPWEKLDLSKEQRQQVRDIVTQHREESRKALHKRLAKVLTEEQLAQLEKMEDRGPGGKSMWDNRPGRPGHRGRREMLTPGRGHHGCGDCDHGRQGRGGRGMRRGGRGMGCKDGPGPRSSEFREERGQRMVERLTVVLDLTDEQAESIARIVKEHHEQFQDFDASKLSREEREKTREAHRMLLANRVKEVLTAEQQEKYDEFMKSMPGPPRGGRGMRR